MENITKIDTRFRLSTIRLMYVWVFGHDIESGKSYNAALNEVEQLLNTANMYDMKARADKIANAGFEAFTSAIQQGVK